MLRDAWRSAQPTHARTHTKWWGRVLRGVVAVLAVGYSCIHLGRVRGLNLKKCICDAFAMS